MYTIGFNYQGQKYVGIYHCTKTRTDKLVKFYCNNRKTLLSHLITFAIDNNPIFADSAITIHLTDENGEKAQICNRVEWQHGTRVCDVDYLNP